MTKAIKYAQVAEHRIVENNAPRPTSGYGRKIPTAHQIRLPGESHWRKVHATCLSNVSSYYILSLGGTLYVSDKDMGE